MIKNQNINFEYWDNLIILDACRYDYFKKIYKSYLDGNLEKRISNGSGTGEWLVNTFPNKYKYTYISSNPYINSYGVPINKSSLELRNYHWSAVEHFSKIIDVWGFGWNEELNTTHPNEVNKSYLSHKDNNKTIIHYIQPHYPYLSYIDVYKTRRIIKKKFNKNVNTILNRIFQPQKRPIYWMKFINLVYSIDKLDPLERMCMEIGIEKLLHYYEENLRIVLKYVTQLIEELNGKIIITSDHGEAFGEQGIWAHPIKTHIPVLMEVPWFEVKK